jgi:hypothetical protein
MYKLLTGRENHFLTQYQDFLLHQEMKDSFICLVNSAANEIGAKIEIMSSFRSFERQLIGWNLKAQGQRPLYDENDQIIPFDSLTSEQLMFAILKWSAVPGASRHHWGTDVDIFDARNIQRNDVKLLQSECLPNGPCGELHQWLDSKIRDNKSFGFYRPYDTERGGVGIEKWHLSYAPTARILEKAYTLEYFIQNINEAEIELKEQLLDNASILYQKYVINTDKCPF